MIAATPTAPRRMLGGMKRLAIVVLLCLAACGGDADTSAPTPSPSPTITATAIPEETETVEPSPESEECSDQTITGNIEVTIRETDNAFSPACVIVLGAQGLELLNKGSSKHNFSIEGTSVDLDTEPGAATRTEGLSGAIEAGTYPFFCKYHRELGMEGEITLTEAG